MFNWLRKLFKPDRYENKVLFPELPFVWCLTGNVIGKHYYGVGKEIKEGTKHFAPQTKVYCLPMIWGDGYENIRVIGKHRKSRKYVCLVMPSRLITNWRLDKVYSPFLLDKMRVQSGWTNEEKDKETILEMMKWLPSQAEELR
jgi:hypothetical protein